MIQLSGKGILWLCHHKSKDGLNRNKDIREATGRFKEKFGKDPDICFVNPDQLNEFDDVDVDDVDVVSLKCVPAEHILVGRERNDGNKSA